jgi:MFS family permease
VRDDSGGRRLRAFRSLAGNRALLRVLAAYLLFILTEYAVWIAMLVFAYNRGGTAVAGFVAVAQLIPAAVVAPLAASVADRRSPVSLLAGGYLAQTAGMAGTAVAIAAGAPLAAYAAAVFASTAVTTTRPAAAAHQRGPPVADRHPAGRQGQARGHPGRAAAEPLIPSRARTERRCP